MLSSIALVSLLLVSTATSLVTPTFDNAQPSRPSPLHVAPPPAILLSKLQVNRLNYQYDAEANGRPGSKKFKQMKKIIAATAPVVAPVLLARSPFFGGLPDLVPQVLGNLGVPLPEWSNPLPTNPKSLQSAVPPTTTPAIPISTAQPGGSLATMNCVNSTGTDQTINSLLFYGGAGQSQFS